MDFIKQIAKALSAVAAAYVVAQLVKRGLSVDAVTQTSLENLIGAVVVGVVVWAVPNKPKA